MAKMKKPAEDDGNPKDRLGVKKAPLGLLSGVAKIYFSLAFAEGARKYGEFNWRQKKVKRTVYLDAIERHLIALRAGEDIDPDSGLPHEAKIGACCALLLDAAAAGCLIDDRYEKDGAAVLLNALAAQSGYSAAAAEITRTPARTLDEVRAEAARRSKRS